MLRHPWFIATLFDAYRAFVSFYVWVAWKEPAFAARALWFVAIIALGNIAMSLYFLRELFRIPAGGSVDAVFIRRNDGPVLMPAFPAALGIAIYFVA